MFRPKNRPGGWPAKPLSSTATIKKGPQKRTQGKQPIMNDVDTAHTTTPFKVGILTLSDRSSAGVRPDASGPGVRDTLQQQLAHAFEVAVYEVIPDDRKQIEQKLVEWSDSLKLNLILTTGG